MKQNDTPPNHNFNLKLQQQDQSVLDFKVFNLG